MSMTTRPGMIATLASSKRESVGVDDEPVTRGGKTLLSFFEGTKARKISMKLQIMDVPT